MSTVLFVDGAYLHKVFKSGSVHDKVDHRKLRSFVERDAGESLEEAYFFNADENPPRAHILHATLKIPPPDGPGFRVKIYGMKKVKHKWPPHLGGKPVVHPELKDVKGTPIPYETTIQKGVDVGLVYSMTRSWERIRWTKLYLISGDGDFSEPIQDLVEREGVELILVGSKGTISADLSAYAKRILDITEPHTHEELLLKEAIHRS